jgi:hypothetical protein
LSLISSSFHLPDSAQLGFRVWCGNCCCEGAVAGAWRHGGWQEGVAVNIK